MPPVPSSVRQDTVVERFIEHAIFASRWLLAPIYLGLSVSLCILLVKFVQRTIGLVSHVLTNEGTTTTVEILSLVELSLMANLVLMVMFSGYENFVSRLRVDHRDRPDWMEHIGFGDLKLKLMTSIVAISAIQVLEYFVDVGHYSNRELAWSVGIHLAFIVSAVLLALMDRLSGKSHA